MAEKETFQLTLPASEIDAALLAAKNAVTYEPQTLTEEQQAQVRANIGIAQQSSTGGIPEVDFGELTASEDGSGYYTSVDANLFQDYPCFLGKVSMQENGTTSSVYLLFTKFDSIIWTGYTRTTSNFGSLEIVGSIMAQAYTSVLILTIAPVADAEVIGDIDAALDAILAIQNELIGGDGA